MRHLFPKDRFVLSGESGFYRLRDGQQRLGGTKGREHPVMSAANRRKLEDFYRPFNEMLYETLGRNFGWDD